MKIARQTETEFVVEESSIWISVLFLLASLPIFYAATLPGRRINLLGGVFFLLFALLALRKATFAFDATQCVVRWRNFRLLGARSGAIPFNEITGIGIETTPGQAGSTLYRLTIQTATGSRPLSISYGGPAERYTSARQRILLFLRSAPTQAPACLESTMDADASVRALLQQGRRIDAIRLLRSEENLDLPEAMKRIDRIASRMPRTRQQ